MWQCVPAFVMATRCSKWFPRAYACGCAVLYKDGSLASTTKGRPRPAAPQTGALNCCELTVDTRLQTALGHSSSYLAATAAAQRPVEMACCPHESPPPPPCTLTKLRKCCSLRCKAGLGGSSDVAVVGDEGPSNDGCREAHAAQLPVVLAEVQELHTWGKFTVSFEPRMTRQGTRP